MRLRLERVTIQISNKYGDFNLLKSGVDAPFQAARLSRGD